MKDKLTDLKILVAMSTVAGLAPLSFAILKHIPKPSDAEIQNLNPEAVKVLVDWCWACSYAVLPALGIGYLVIAVSLCVHIAKRARASRAE